MLLTGPIDEHHKAYARFLLAPPIEQVGYLERLPGEACLRTRALLDTGANYSFTSSAAAESLGLQPCGKPEMGQGAVCIPFAASFVACLEGGFYVLPQRIVVAREPVDPNDPDLIIGMRELALGKFLIDGPRSRWLWRLP